MGGAEGDAKAFDIAPQTGDEQFARDDRHGGQGGARNTRQQSASNSGRSASLPAYRPTLDSAKSSRARERRKACVTITWIRDCVFA